MSYIYDLLLNFNKIIYEFYDWNSQDKMTRIRKMPIIKITTKDYLNIKYNIVKFDKNVLNLINNKTETINNKKMTSCIFADSTNTVAVMVNTSGIVIKKSSLLIEEELDILEICHNIKPRIIKYELLSKPTIETFKTRKEEQIETYIIKELKKIEEEGNSEKLKYLYLECFNKKSSKDNLADCILKAIETNFDEVYPLIYSFLKLSNKKSLKIL